VSLVERQDASAPDYPRVSCHRNQLAVLALGVLPYAPTALLRYRAEQAPPLHHYQAASYTTPTIRP
jgi:hypothetical protein